MHTGDQSIPDWLIWYPSMLLLVLSFQLLPELTLSLACNRLKYFSLWKYGYQILARNEFEDLTFSCSSSDIVCIPSTHPRVFALYVFHFIPIA